MTPKFRPEPVTETFAPWTAVFRHRDFTYFWVAALISNSSQWMQQLALPFLVFELTDSNTWVGATAFATLIPAWFINPVAGVLADRVNRRLVLFVTLMAQAIVASSFATLWAIGELTPWRILILSAIQGIAAGFQIASWQSFVPTLVPPELLLTAVRLNSSQFTAARALGPLAGAGLLAFVGFGSVFVVNSATFVVLLAVLLTVRPRVAQPLNPDPPYQVFKEGLQYVAARTALLQAIFLGFSISFLGQSLVQIAAGLAKDDYGVSETGLAGFITAVGAGSVLASALLIARGDYFPRSKTSLAGFCCYSAGLILTAATGEYLVGLTGFFLMGFAHITIAISANTAVQIQVSEEVRGRVVSIYLMGVFGGIPMGAFLGGSLGDLVGLRYVYFGAGVIMALLAVVAQFGMGGLRRLDRNSDSLTDGLTDGSDDVSDDLPAAPTETTPPPLPQSEE